MAKNRYINTGFWSDSYIETLDPSEKLLFLYFLTNDHTDLSGIYELSVRRMTIDTGFEKDTVLRMIEKFTKSNKVYFFDNKWVYIKNFTKHQRINPSIQAGIQRSLATIPKEIIEKVRELDSEFVQSVPDSNRLSQSDTLYSTLPNSTLPNSTLPNSTPASKSKIETPLQQVVNHFYELKGWDWQDSRYKKIYARFTRPARELLELTSNDVLEAKRKLTVVSQWATTRKLDWSIETVFKKWFDIPQLKPKEKKPTWQGMPLFKDKSGKWKLIDKEGVIKIFNSSEKEIEWV